MFALLFFAALAQAIPQFGGNQRFTMLRFGCAQTVIDRIDPLVNPGQAPSPHMHQIAGGNAFNTTMQSTDISKLATCTTCGYSEDLSNYWTANMYFKARNGTYKRVPQIPNRDLFNDKYTGKTTGGFVVYYVSGGKGDVTAFKPGFRMLVGDVTSRVSKNRKSQSCFRCYTAPNFGGDNAAPCQDAKYFTHLLFSSIDVLKVPDSIQKASLQLHAQEASAATFSTRHAGTVSISTLQTTNRTSRIRSTAPRYSPAPAQAGPARQRTRSRFHK
ncbi:hypothetical protein ACJQWK_04282 [Exserohilum turcicum]